MCLLTNIKQYIKYWLLAMFILGMFFWSKTIAADDLLRQIVKPSYDKSTVLKVWENVERVGDKVFEGSTEADVGARKISNKGSIIVKVIKMLLILTITLSITMILYNWAKYIVEVWSGKDGKSLTKNIAYIIIGILVALFSTTIIALLQSIPSSLDKIPQESNNTTDNKVVDGK